MPVRILVAPDKFKGTFSSAEVCRHLAVGLADAGIHSPPPTVDLLPLADGGEGTLDVVMAARGGSLHHVTVEGPLGRPVEAIYGVTPDGTAVLESARFCGLGLVHASLRDPLRSTSAGLGQVVLAALRSGIGRLLVCLGGTATMDGGLGMARALGYRFHDAAGDETILTPRDLPRLDRIDATCAEPLLADAEITALHDVTTPLCGAAGAARRFGPQKGASPAQVDSLEEGLLRLAREMSRMVGGRTEEIGALAGGGAAGGLGAAAKVFLGAHLVLGAPYLLDMARFEQKLSGCDVVVTGEGAFDSQSLEGKLTGTILKAAGKSGKRVAVVAGSWDGSQPAGLAQEVEIFTGASLSGAPRSLTAEDLAALGRLIAARIASK